MAVPLAIGLVAATLAGCVLKKPPDAAALKELALPGMLPPAQWTAGISAFTTVFATIAVHGHCRGRRVDFAPRGIPAC